MRAASLASIVLYHKVKYTQANIQRGACCLPIIGGISPPIVGRIFRRSSGKCVSMPDSRADKWRSTDQITRWAWKRKAAPWMRYAQTAMIRDEGKMHQSPRLEKSKNFLIIVRLSGFILLYFGLHGLTLKCRKALKILTFFAFGWHGITAQIVTPKW